MGAGAILTLIVVSAGLAALLVPLAHVTFADTCLATTPSRARRSFHEGVISASRPTWKVLS
jgi:hypothetical protein